MSLRRVAVVLSLLLVPASPAASHPLPQAPNCPVFPETNVWNKRVWSLPLRKDSRTIVNAIGARLSLHADFGAGLWDGGPIGIPITVVDSTTPRSSVDFDSADESDVGPYPIPNDVAIEGGPAADGDRSTRMPAGSMSSSTSSRPGRWVRGRSGT